MTPQREIFWNVAPIAATALYVLSGLCVGWIILWFYRRSRLWRQGSPAPRLGSWRDGARRLAEYLGTHRTLRRDRYAGWMHGLMFWGFVVLLIATTLVGIQEHSGVEFLKGGFYLVFKFCSNLGGLAFCAGLGLALWRRRSEAAHGRLARNAAITVLLVGMLVLAVTGFLVAAARIAVDFPGFERWGFVSYGFAVALGAAGFTGAKAAELHGALWLLHAAGAIAFFVFVPISLLKHFFLASYSLMRPASRPGRMSEPSEPVTTAVDLPHFRDLDLVHADACLTCGRCAEVCPAEAAGKPLSPRSVVLGLRAHLDEPQVPLAQQVGDPALWSCTSCHACDAACPIDIHIFDKIATLRRGRVAEGEVPATLAEALESTAQKSNPFGQPNSARMEWAAGLPVPVAQPDEQVELLYWIGCSGAFDPAGRQVSRAVITLLNRLKIKYRVMGCRERCSGDPARRSGEEGLWRELATGNQAKFSAHGVKTILTQCPHCFNSFKNEYPSVGPMPVVLHHSQWLKLQLADGRLKLKPGAAEKITFHDPCYLSRANDETEAPREVLAQLPAAETVEMEKHGRKSFCCGGGGGQMWLDVRGQSRVETIRAAHVEATGAQTVATGCPFCRSMLEAGRAGLPEGQGKWRVQDLAELVVEQLEPEGPA